MPKNPGLALDESMLRKVINSTGDQDVLEFLITHEAHLKRITVEDVDSILRTLKTKPTCDTETLVRAIQGALFWSLPSDLDRRSNELLKREREKLATRATHLNEQLLPLINELSQDLCEQLAQGSPDDEIDELRDQIFERMRRLYDDVYWLKWVALKTASMPRARPSSERRASRIKMAWCLSPVYEKAFGRSATADFNGQLRGNWPRFFEGVLALAFGKESIPDLQGVLNEARRRHVRAPAKFPPGVLPRFS